MTGTHPTTIGDNVTVGHGALIHGCTIEDQCLIGMGAILLNGAHIGTGSIVAAGTLLVEGMKVPPRSLVMGSPGKVKRLLTQAEVADIQLYADRYVGYRLDYMVRACQAELRRRAAQVDIQARPSGTRDFLPDDIRRREYVIGVVRDVYERYGFEPLETPAFENIETLLGKYGEEGNKLIFKILKRGEHEASGEADLALRYDLTVPLARVVAQYQNELPRFFKRYQIQPVWRADRPARGRFREFYQCDIDAIGSTSPVVEAELLGGGQRGADARSGSTISSIRLNHRRVLTALLEAAGVPRAAARRRAGRARQAGQDRRRGRARRSWRRAASTRRRRSACLDAVRRRRRRRPRRRLERCAIRWRPRRGPTRWPISTDRRLADGDAGARAGSGSIRAWRAGCHTTRARSWRSRSEGIGSLGGGGRYDNLVGMFLGRDVPACGFSLGLERIIVVMTEREHVSRRGGAAARST